MIALIAAVAKNNVIGISNDLPWYLPEDLKRFKRMTLNKVVIMGRKTYDSIVARLKKPLPDRTNVVISSRTNLMLPSGVEHFHSIADALEAHPSQPVFIIGGAQIFNQSIDLADTLYITAIDKDYDGDVFFPKINHHEWEKIAEEPHQGFSFLTYRRKR